MFSRLFASRGATLWLPTAVPFIPGSSVRVGVRERELMCAAVVLYGVPLLAFILAAVAAATVFEQTPGQDLGALLIGVICAASAWALAGRLRSRILNPRVESLSGTAEQVASATCANSEP